MSDAATPEYPPHEFEVSQQKQLAALMKQLTRAIDTEKQIELGNKIIELDATILDYWLNQDQSHWQRIAAEVLLKRRLENLYFIDDKRQIDLRYLTCIEYQLFLDEKRPHSFYQPDHWLNYSFSKGQAQEFVLEYGRTMPTLFVSG
jgi:hypothetical protein